MYKIVSKENQKISKFVLTMNHARHLTVETQ